jgi:hypothetical protein
MYKLYTSSASTASLFRICKDFFSDPDPRIRIQIPRPINYTAPVGSGYFQDYFEATEQKMLSKIIPLVINYFFKILTF